MPTYGGMLMAQVTWGFGYTFISGALTAWITDEVGEDKVEAILLEGTQISAIAEGVGDCFGSSVEYDCFEMANSFVWSFCLFFWLA